MVVFSAIFFDNGMAVVLSVALLSAEWSTTLGERGQSTGKRTASGNDPDDVNKSADAAPERQILRCENGAGSDYRRRRLGEAEPAKAGSAGRAPAAMTIGAAHMVTAWRAPPARATASRRVDRRRHLRVERDRPRGNGRLGLREERAAEHHDGGDGGSSKECAHLMPFPRDIHLIRLTR